MTVTTVETNSPTPADEADVLVGRRSVKGPLATTVIAVLGAAAFTYLAPPHKTTTFVFTLGIESYKVPNLVVNSRTGALVFGIVAVVFALLTWLPFLLASGAAAQSSRRLLWTKRLSIVLIGVSMTALFMSFLCWAVAGKSIPITGLLQGSVLLAVPLIYGAMSGVLSERAGVININIEGQLLTGAFLAAVVASVTQNLWIGLAAAPIGGLLLGFLLAMFATKYFVDQVVVGVVLNVLAVGITSFLYSQVLVPYQNRLNSPPTFNPIALPGLSKIPVLGPVLFDQNILVYIMYVVVVAVQYYLFHTRWGLRVRSVGEYPDAADSVGIRVNRTRFRTVLIASAIAGLGGAFFTIGQVGPFGRELTSGKGFIALAAVIFGRWTPLGALGAALLFGFASNLQYVLSIIGTPIPSQFLLMTPYIATILAVAGLVGKVRAPGADGIPFRKS